VKLLEALKNKDVLLGDGANGTCLNERGFARQPYDLANLLSPDMVRAVHAEYFDAGADFVETNTFEANRFRLADFNADIREINLAGARLAREAAGPDKLVLGAIGPAGKPMEPIGSITAEQISEAVREQAEALAEGGVDGFILETYIDVDELCVAVDAVREVSQLPIIVSKAYIEDGEMLAEGLPFRCAKRMAEMGVIAVGANCVVGPQRMLDLVRQIAEGTDLPVVAFPTPGLPQLLKGQIAYDTSPEYFAKAAARLVEEGARIVGGCCGTTPEHIRHLRRVLDSGKIKVKPRQKVVAQVKEREPLPESEPSELCEKIGKKFITAVEMDLPRGLKIEKLLAGARSLKIAGVDVINISDGARARLRMNPMSIGSIIQNRVGIEVTMHFSCRDRNLLAVQSDLLGCHAMGLRNILAVTGDPANIGDYPSATSVFDIDAIGLVRIMSRFNEGIDLAGYSVGVKCAFTVCAAYNPISLDPELELDRLRRKADAGAHVIYTQPVFETETAEKAVEDCAKVGLPCFVGVLPLRSQRHAEFMHNEVPGIRIPDWLRQRMVDAEDDAAALQAGIEESQKLAEHIRKTAQGLYLMPPFGNHQIAEKVMAPILS
jgi:methionine synthase / methylenetetrahydrofolate reductase(NADPH)